MTTTDVSTDVASIDLRALANAIRALSMDAVQAANSGHPGMPMGMADAATVLFNDFLRFDPQRPNWPDRDRFVLSAGHGSMLLYALLYLTGYEDMDLSQIKSFRQLGSRTAGHPEFGHAGGIETTTGPLGQGLANAVGMAIAERALAARFGDALVDHHTYVIVGDGCLMEGISHEAASLAGHLALAKLIVLYDDNGISIDGPTSLSFSDDSRSRFQGYGWHVQQIDGHDHVAVAAAIRAAREAERPSLIACKTEIGYGAPTKAGTAAVHGNPLGEDEIAGARDKLAWPYPAFEVPQDVLAVWRAIGAAGGRTADAWHERLRALDRDERVAFERAIAGELSAGFGAVLESYKQALAEEQPSTATRQSSGRFLEVLDAEVPELIGGSADLTGSNNTRTPAHSTFSADDPSGRYIYYGVREHAMAAAMNGMALHGGVIPYGGTFLIFTDYCRPAIRLSALMGQRVIYVMTHDSIGLGQDGPTHQPIEHLASLRAIPNLNVFRPADAVEVAECWAAALAHKDRPSILALTRQGVPALRLEHELENLCAGGAYELLAADGTAQVTLLATGSEVCIAVTARNMLQSAGIATRVVSMPCWELFAERPAEERVAVLGLETYRVAIEAGSGFGWERYTSGPEAVVGMTGFGASAPAKDLFRHFNITAEAVVEAVKNGLSEAAPNGAGNEE